MLNGKGVALFRTTPNPVSKNILINPCGFGRSVFDSQFSSFGCPSFARKLAVAAAY